jgi:uncharacterized OB-fold protein
METKENKKLMAFKCRGCGKRRLSPSYPSECDECGSENWTIASYHYRPRKIVNY